MKVAKSFWPCMLAICFILSGEIAFTQTATAVNLNTVINVDKTKSTFESLLHSISVQSGIVFSFSSKRIASTKVLQIHPGKQTLGNVLQQINKATGLEYKVVGTHIIFLDQQTSLAKDVPTGKTSAKVINKSPSSPSSSRRNPAAQKQTGAANSKRDTLTKAYDTERSISRKLVDSMNVADNKTVTSKPITLSDSTRKFADSFSIVTINAQKGRADSLQGGDETSVKDSLLPAAQQKNSVSRNVEREIEYADSKTTWVIGAQVSRSAGMENKSETMNTTGIGLHLKMERAFSRKWSYTVGIEYDYFTGKYTYNLFNGPSKDTTIKHFAIAPVLAGVRYQVSNRLYLSGEFGPSLKASSQVRTKLALAPSAGIVFPTKNGALDVSLRYVHVVAGYGILESNSLQNGGYSFVSLKASYRINHGRLSGRSRNRLRSSNDQSQAFLKGSTKVDLSGQGVAVSMEPKLGAQTMLDLSLGIGGGYDVMDRLRYKIDVSNPALHFSLTPKFFYNWRKRVQSGKLSDLNSGNYVGLRVKYVTRGIGPDPSVFDTFLMNLHWGLQRAIASRLLFGAHVGAGYAFDVTDLSNPYDSFYPSFDAKLSYVLSRAKR